MLTSQVLFGLMLVVLTRADIERLPLGEDDYGDKLYKEYYSLNVNHRPILGTKKNVAEFANLDSDAAKSRLHEIITEMDIDSDGQITNEELADRIKLAAIMRNEEEAHEELEDIVGADRDHITWGEYMVHMYEHTPEQVNLMEPGPDTKALLELIKEDQLKFEASDLNDDGKLDTLEFASFVHPYNYPHTLDNEVKLAMRFHDANQDGVIDFSEYQANTPRMQSVEREKFDNYDMNNDGKLDASEMQAWAVPTDPRHGQIVTDHLFTVTDKDKNGRLSIDEIMNNYEMWVGARAADGEDNIREEL